MFWNATQCFCNCATWFSFSFTRSHFAQSHLRVWFIAVFVSLKSGQHHYSLNRRSGLLDVWVALLRSRAPFHSEWRMLHWVRVQFFLKRLVFECSYSNTRLQRCLPPPDLPVKETQNHRKWMSANPKDHSYWLFYALLMLIVFLNTQTWFFLSTDFLHDLSLGQNVQDFWYRVHSIPASGDAIGDESCIHQAGSSSHWWFVSKVFLHQFRNFLYSDEIHKSGLFCLTLFWVFSRYFV